MKILRNGNVCVIRGKLIKTIFLAHLKIKKIWRKKLQKKNRCFLHWIKEKNNYGSGEKTQKNVI